MFICKSFSSRTSDSKWYNLNLYKSALTNAINSQVNKQANAGLQHIKSQLANMSPENFMHTVSLFLAIKTKMLLRN